MSDVTLHKPDGWSAQFHIEKSNLLTGETALVEPIIEGIDPKELWLNFTWSSEGRWDEGNWDSTYNRTGSYTQETSWVFDPPHEGRYQIFVDINDSTSGTTAV